MNIHLVTGGAGFIGSHLVDLLVAEGHQVRVLDNLSSGKIANIQHEDVELYSGDIRDGKAVQSAMRGVSHVYHLAALGSVPRSIENPGETIEVNVNGTLRVLEAAREAGVERFVFASSSSVYGDSQLFPRDETQETIPLSPYALSKRVGEELCLLNHRMHNFPAVVLRYFNVFGPRQRAFGPYTALIPRLIVAIHRGEAPEIYGDGKQSRDFTYVKTAAEATLKAGALPHAVGQIFNVASGKEYSVMNLVALLSASQGLTRTVDVRYSPPRDGDVPRSLADISLMRDELHVEPYPLPEGLGETIQWFKENL